MNMNVINKLMSMLPEGEKKEALRQKINLLAAKSKKRGGDGLQDVFEFQPKGHIKIEAIDENGNVVGVLADQPNLVVDGAEEILLRAFSGDPNRILYKNRVVKATSGVTPKIYISESKLGGSPIIDNGQLVHPPNLLWAEVDDELFDISYGFYPNTVYIKEEVSTEVGKRAFTISNTPAPDRVPMSAEIYSTYTNLFIGIGEGKNYSVPLTDPRLEFSNDFTVTDTRAETTVEGASLEVTAKMSNFKVEVEASDTGAQIDVYINGVLRETIETFDSGLSTPEVRVFEYDGLDYETETTIRLVHSGSDSGAATPVMAITGFYFDALHKGMNGLMKEFKNFETEFTTPTAYNTTPMAPYTIQLPYFPLAEGSVKISYEGVDFTEVDSEAQLTDTSFVVDHFRGIITFNRALTGVMVTYAITGELYDSEMVSTMTAGNIPVTTVTVTPVTNEIPTGAINGSNVDFTVAHSNVDPASLVVRVDGTPTTDFTFNATTRTITMNTPPAMGQTLSVDYNYTTSTTDNRPANLYHTQFPVVPGSVKVFDQDGTELQLVTDVHDFLDGTFMVDDTDLTLIKIAKNKADGQPLTRIEICYRSDERPGVPTNYTRAVIQKPKTVNEYPWFELDKGSVKFVAEFPELKPVHNITIREMGLFDGPRAEDGIAGYRNYPVKAFSLVRVGETRKEANTGIRITWTITLLNADGQPFQGGRN
jgi:hypothetical protein